MRPRPHRIPLIGVCGPRDVERTIGLQAFELGRLIAEAGYGVVCGGLGGIMDYVARGVHAANEAGAAGLVVGILPGDNPTAANPHCHIVIPSGMGLARNVLIVQTAAAVILVGGGSGTLSEAALAWQLGKAVISLEGSGGWADRLSGELIDRRRDDGVLPAGSVQLAVDLAARALSQKY